MVQVGKRVSSGVQERHEEGRRTTRGGLVEENECRATDRDYAAAQLNAAKIKSR